MTLLVRDEEDIVDATMRFHLEHGVDLVLVTDNLSLDRTRDLLVPYERAGVARVWSEPNDEYRQWEWVSRMAQAAATTYGADWVLHCDADEFWWSDRPLPEVLAAVPPAYDVVLAPRHDFPPQEPDDGRPFQERMTLRDTAPVTIMGRPLMPKCAHRARDDVIVAQGNHFVVNEGMAELPGLLDATILHFPVRTYAQLERKVVLGGRAYARNRDMPATVGSTWRALHRAYLAGELRSYYNGLVPGAPAVAAGLATGRYVVDTRLRDALSGRDAARPAPPTLELTGDPAAAVSALRAVEAPSAGSPTTADEVEQALMAFVDDARASVVVVAREVVACGVLAALASARARGLDVRLLTVDAAAAARWRLDEVTRLVPDDVSAGLVLRDDTEVWRGPASPSGETLREPARSTGVSAMPPGLSDAVETLWSRAVRPVPRAEPQLVGGVR